jgi:hypothetical protein
MDVHDHADEPANWTRAANVSRNEPITILSLDLVEAADIGGEYPQFGKFLPVEIDGDETWLECPRGLSQSLSRLGVEEGESIRVQDLSKDDDGHWQFKIV